jgi:hypothetical protein
MINPLTDTDSAKLAMALIEADSREKINELLASNTPALIALAVIEASYKESSTMDAAEDVLINAHQDLIMDCVGKDPRLTDRNSDFTKTFNEYADLCGITRNTKTEDEPSVNMEVHLDWMAQKEFECKSPEEKATIWAKKSLEPKWKTIAGENGHVFVEKEGRSWELKPHQVFMNVCLPEENLPEGGFLKSELVEIDLGAKTNPFANDLGIIKSRILEATGVYDHYTTGEVKTQKLIYFLNGLEKGSVVLVN